MIQRLSETPVLEDLITWKPMLKKVETSLERIQITTEPMYINFWGGHGVGKTMLMELMYQSFKDRNDLRVLGPWNVEKTLYSILAADISSAFENAPQNPSKLLILLDNLEALSTADRLEFENDLLLNAVQGKYTLVVATSKSRLEWRDPTLRRRSFFSLILPLVQEDVRKTASAWGIDPAKAYTLSFGNPQVLMWLKGNSMLTSEDICSRAFDFFLGELTEPAKELALFASLLPGFDLPALREIIPGTSQLASLSHQDLNEYLFELLMQGLIFHDEEHKYYFYRYCDSSIRQLLALHLKQKNPGIFKVIHQNANQYFQEEAKRHEYLPLVFLNVLYHLAQLSSSNKEASARCLSWTKKHLKPAMKEEGPALIQAWNTGNGDSQLMEELQTLTSVQCLDQIRALLT